MEHATGDRNNEMPKGFINSKGLLFYLKKAKFRLLGSNNFSDISESAFLGSNNFSETSESAFLGSDRFSVKVRTESEGRDYLDTARVSIKTFEPKFDS